MAFTPEQEALLLAIANGIVSAGFTEPVQFQGAMTLVKLQNELKTLESQLNNLVGERNAYVEAMNAEIDAKQAEVNAKMEEINGYIANL